MKNIASHVIQKCGGAHKVAAWLNISPVTVYRWTYPASRGGSDGLIPANRQNDLLQHARAAGIALNPYDFFDLDPASDVTPQARHVAEPIS